MPSTTGHYDHNLLASAPAATKKQLQEGYTTEILAPVRKPEPAPAAASDPELAQPRSGSRPPTTIDDADYYPEKKVPFWRTTKGIVIIVIAVIAVLGAVIGGAVGGTVGRNNNSSSSSESDGQDGTIATPTAEVPIPPKGSDVNGIPSGAEPTQTNTDPRGSEAGQMNQDASPTGGIMRGDAFVIKPDTKGSHYH
ncbi:hypothetical protein AX16_007332 [Volvariella volvacea WC 439]|nr:hypothetical protein AX16_007332 [Volvariella volvacea WC 439]